MAIRPPNYTQTPNEIFDEWLPKLKLVELRVLMIISRQTFGWHKKRDRISLSQLEKKTGSQRSDIIEATRHLEELGLIRIEKRGKIGFQHTYYELVMEDSNNSYQCESHTPPVCISHPPSVNFTPTKETLPKETNIKEIYTPSPSASELASFLFSAIKEVKPNYTKQISPQWLKDAEWLLKRRTMDELKLIIHFMLHDNFWSGTKGEMSCLKENLDQLEKQMKRGKTFIKKEDLKDKHQEMIRKLLQDFPDLAHPNSKFDVGPDYIGQRGFGNWLGTCFKIGDKGFEGEEQRIRQEQEAIAR